MNRSTKELMQELLCKVKLMRDLMSESEGVAGYHANGEVMTWEEWEDLTPEALDALIEEANDIL